MWRAIGRAAAILGSGLFLLTLFQLAFRLLATTSLEPAAYGRAAVALTAFNTLVAIASAGVPTAVSRHAAVPERSDARLLRIGARAVSTPSAVASVAVAGVLWVVLDSIWLAAVSALTLPFFVTSILCAAWLRGNGRVTAAAAVQPVNGVVQLVALTGFFLAGEVSASTVVLSFAAGNVGAAVAAAALIRRPVSRPAAAVPSARALAAEGAWLGAGNVAVWGLLLSSQVAVGRISYAEAAFLDIALVTFSLLARVRATLVAALVPVVARGAATGGRLSVPGRGDAAVLLGCAAIVSLGLWATHTPRAVLEAIGLGAYGEAEPYLLILVLAVPAEFLFGIHSGVLAASGRARATALVCGAVLLATVTVLPVAVAVDPVAAAVVLVVAYWALYLGARTRSGAASHERQVFPSLLLRGSRP